MKVQIYKDALFLWFLLETACLLATALSSLFGLLYYQQMSMDAATFVLCFGGLGCGLLYVNARKEMK